ncbi:MAG: peptidoglycan DD-metalloendopeptidase family protein [Alphaproteobacteria bacterium]|nr:peptidoglycan DD-metalloendopeptidase family protein [Alphaproteobacteria bacterium]
MSTHRARILATAIVASLSVGLLSFAVNADALTDHAAISKPTAALKARPPSRFAELVHTIRRGEVLGAILPRYGVTDVQAVVAAGKPYADLTRIRAGKDLRLRFERDVPHPLSIAYALDEDRTLVIDLTTDPPTARVEEVEYETRLEVRRLTLTSSLWDAALSAGLRPGDVVRLAEIFQWELDFNTELRNGASFTIVSDDLYNDGDFTRPGAFYAVRLLNDDKEYTAFHYVSSDGTEGWYHPDGSASKKPFLRSPLEFARVTSSYNPKRYHPILKTRRPHLGTDFGAPTGTPVRAVGDGVVVIAGRSGGHGNRVKIDHAGPYATSYSHLSKVKVKNGQRVRQGDVIGLVGSTGLSTGPHLHYEVTVNGNHTDAMKVKFPTSEPLPASELAAFAQVRDRWMPVLDGTAPLPVPNDGLVDGQDALADGD